jgi:hypothetical protein
MFWKIYFWILFSILGFGYAGMFQKGLSTIYIIDLIISVPSLVVFSCLPIKKLY